MKSAIILLAVLFLSTVTFSATIYVPDDYPTIQAAIDASAPGGTVIVRPGTYVENVDFAGMAITVMSEQGPAVTIIDGNQTGSVVKFASGEDSWSVLSGFTITNGTGSPDGYGSLSGGGIYCKGASPTITNNSIVNNSSTRFGGGIFCKSISSPTIMSNTIAGNSTIDGGGIHCVDSDPTITCNIILWNAAAGGGGINIQTQSYHPIITDNIIAGNSASSRGGGINCIGSSPRLENNTITNNTANSIGGGINCETWTLAITNSIFWDNFSPSGPEIHVVYGSLSVNYCDVKGGWSGTGNIDADPLFVDPANNDFHLTWNSPCRNAGYNLPDLPELDFEGDPRIALGTVDMGTDEYYYHLYHMGEVVPGFPIDIKVVGYPTAPVLLALGSSIQDPPINTQHGDLWLNWPPLWQGSIGTVPGNGILVLPATVPSGWSTGENHYLQTLIGPWGGPYTRLSNLLTLTVE